MPDSLSQIPKRVRRDVAHLAAEVIERAASIGEDRWGVTPFSDGIRVNVGWTEILTARPDHLRLTVDGALASSAEPGRAASLFVGDDDRGFYPSIPGSMLAEISYASLDAFRVAIEELRPASARAIDLAGRRRAGLGVKEGHRQEVVSELAELVGRSLPTPEAAVEHRSDDDGATLMEGALRRVVSSQYERNPAGRDACLAHHGYACAVCGFSFAAVYGELGSGFIHVHHIVPVSTRRGQYEVDPIADLIPVCPNCHAMLHRSEPPLSVLELRNLISQG